MKRKVENWTVEALHKERPRISFPEYQRQAHLWSYEKKSLLIDSILRDIDIPKLYFSLAEDGSFEVVDGQQRLWAIWEFLDDGYPYKVNGKEQRFSDLGRNEKERIKNYTLQVAVFEDADDEYLRQLFLRLQLGLLLNTGEKLNAAAGAMKELVFEKLATHQFIVKLGIPNRRFARETLCAQICINSFARAKNNAFARTRYEDLLNFFKEYAHPQGKDLEFFRGGEKRIPSVLDQLRGCLGDRERDLRNRSYILSIYLFFEEMLSNGTKGSNNEQRKYADFVLILWERLKDEISAGIDRKNKELYIFETLISSAPGERYQIERRHEKLAEYYSHYKKSGKIKGD